ncbi:MAG: ABC transporter substrate-binding protein [Lactobacillaceae bacterium]|nr:ABC transporter substrate-binding protein [Lactobacillaceae bacterium]
MRKVYISFLLLFLALGGSYFYDQNAKQSTQKPTVAIMQFVTHPALDAIHTGIIDELKKEGFVDKKNINIDFQNAQADQSNLKTIANKFAESNPAVSVGIATPAAISIANTITKSPVIFSASTNPVVSGLIKNVKEPEGNVTGVSDQAPIAGQIKLMQEIIPDLKTVGVIYTSSDDSANTEATRFQELATKVGIKVKMFSITNTNDLNQTANQMVCDSSIQAVFVGTDNTIASAFPTLIAATDSKNIPVFPTVDTMVKQGGVAADSINQHNLGIQTGKQIAQILKGKKVSQIPVVFQKSGDIVINLKQAQKLGLSIPEKIQKSAKEVY